MLLFPPLLINIGIPALTFIVNETIERKHTREARFG